MIEIVRVLLHILYVQCERQEVRARVAYRDGRLSLSPADEVSRLFLTRHSEHFKIFGHRRGLFVKERQDAHSNVSILLDSPNEFISSLKYDRNCEVS
jgi:hypothetical protein